MATEEEERGRIRIFILDVLSLTRLLDNQVKLSNRQGARSGPKVYFGVLKVTRLKTPGKKYRQRKEEVSTKTLNYLSIRELKWNWES